MATHTPKQGGYLLRLFGPMVLEGGDRLYTKFPTKRSALLLACLAVARSQRIGRDELAEMLWPDDYLDLTRIRLRQELRRLRQAVDGFENCLNADRQWVEIEPGCLRTDVQEFDDAIAAANLAQTVEGRIHQLTRAVELLNGPFLAGHQDPWVHATRRTYGEKARRAWLSLADAYQEQDQNERALDATINAVRHDPLDTDANAILIRRLMDRGQGARARQAYLEFDAMLFRELGYHAPASVKSALGVVTQEEEETPHNSEATSKSRVSRPLQTFGRDRLLDTIRGALSRPSASVLLVGCAGVGKSHVIREFAWTFSQANDLPIQFGGAPEPVVDGLYVIDQRLDPGLIADSILRATEMGWRVLAESRTKLDQSGTEVILVNPLPSPTSMMSTQDVKSNPSIQILESQVLEQGYPASSLGGPSALSELATKLEGHASALRYFAYRLLMESPEQILQGFDERIERFVTESFVEGESISSSVQDSIKDLPGYVVDAWIALSIMDGASCEVASQLSQPYDCSEVWHLLEKKSLITVRGNGSARRIRVPIPFAFAIRSIVDPIRYAELQARAWSKFVDWAFTSSRLLTGVKQDVAFTMISQEFGNIRRCLEWGISFEPSLAARLTVASWRTVCARGNPSSESKLLYQAANAGAEFLPPIMAGEAWIGAAISLSVIGNLELADGAFKIGIETYSNAGLKNKTAWALNNYAVLVVAASDKTRASQMLLEAADLAEDLKSRTLALSDYALILASIGGIGEAIEVAEQVFATRLQSNDATDLARAYGDLGELYYVSGRSSAARPLIIEGIRRMREAGIQNMLLDKLICLVEISLADDVVDVEDVTKLLHEAACIATRIGAKQQLLATSRLRLAFASRYEDKSAMIHAIEECFRLTQLSQNVEERCESFRTLASELARHEKTDYASAILASIGDSLICEPHKGWKALLSTQSNVTLCVLAVVLAKEALMA